MLVFREATIEDADTLFRWRNDPGSRANYNNTSLVTWQEHTEWLTDSLERADRKVLIVTENDIDVATVRIEYQDKIGNVAWTVAPEFRNRGIGKRMLREAIEGEAGTMEAVIKTGNRPSMRVAEEAGFRMISEADGKTIWRRD